MKHFVQKKKDEKFWKKKCKILSKKKDEKFWKKSKILGNKKACKILTKKFFGDFLHTCFHTLVFVSSPWRACVGFTNNISSYHSDTSWNNFNGWNNVIDFSVASEIKILISTSNSPHPVSFTSYGGLVTVRTGTAYELNKYFFKDFFYKDKFYKDTFL